MDLVIAVQQLAAVVNVRTAHRAAAREGDRAGRAQSRAGIPAASVRTTHTIPVVDPVAGRDAIPEVDEIRIRASSAVELRRSEDRAAHQEKLAEKREREHDARNRK